MNTHSMRRLLPAAFSLVVLAGTAAAQEKEIQGNINQPLTTTTQSSGSSFVFLSQSDGDDTYQVEINGDKITAKVNGKKIPAERVRRTDNKVEILDKEGNVLTTFDVQVPNAQVRTFTAAPRSGRAGTWTVPAAPEPPQAWWGSAMNEPPKTMIGIRMDDAAEGEVALTDVIEGLPAARAGLKPGDVLVSIAGKKIEKVTDIREAVKDKNPGDKVAVIAKRDGEEKTFQVTLDAYDTEKLMGAMPDDEIARLKDAMSMAGQNTGKFADEARRALEKALKEIESSKSRDDFEKSWSDAMKQAIKALEQHKGEFTTVWGQLATPAPSARPGRTLVAPEGEMVFVEPRGQRNDVNKRLDELAARLEKLGAQLEKLTEQIEKKHP